MSYVLYNYYRSSASYRVRIALNIKGLSYEYRPVHLLNQGGEQHFAGYRELNPSREVPTLVHDGRALAQTVAILDYLEHLHPEPALYPKDPYQRALVLQACEIINSGIQPPTNLRILNELAKRYGVDAEGKESWVQTWASFGLEALEAFLKPHAGLYSFGDAVTAADCFLVPQAFAAERFKCSMDAYPTLKKIRANCEKLEPFAKAHPSKQPDFPPS